MGHGVLENGREIACPFLKYDTFGGDYNRK